MSTGPSRNEPEIAIVTGGSGNIGKAVAQALGTFATVIITARGNPGLISACNELRTDCVYGVHAFPSDATEQDSVDRLVEWVIKDFGRVDILVNCAASTASVAGDIDQTDVSQVLLDLDTKVCGYLRYIKAVAPAMKSSAKGRIINIGGLTGRSSDTLSGLRNAAVSHFTKTLADQLGPWGVTVNAVHPGIVRTPHLSDVFAVQADRTERTLADIEAETIAQIPLRRILDLSEVAGFVRTLTSPECAGVTGQSLTIDGGFSRGIYL